MEDVVGFALIVMLGLAIPEAFHRIRMTPIPLLVIAGILIGPYGLGIIERYPGIEFLGRLGLLFLVFIAGLEVHETTFKNKREPFTLVLLSGYVCFMGGFMLGMVYHLPIVTSLLLGAILMSSSVAEIISIVNATRTVKERFGTVIIPAIVVLDGASLIFLSILIKLREPFWEMLLFIVLAGVFLSVSFWAVPKIGRWFFQQTKKRAAEHEMRFIIAFLVVMVAISELIDLPSIVTAFMAGMLLGEVLPGEKSLAKIHAIGYGFLIPIFFIDLGLGMNVRLLIQNWSVLVFTITLILTLMTTKILGGLIYGTVQRMDVRDSLVTGVVLWPPLSATLAATTVGWEAGLLTQDVFVAIITMAVVIALVTPFAVRILSRKEPLKRNLAEHIVVLGCGRVGSRLVDVLIESNEDFVVIDRDLGTVDALRHRWVDAIYGDAADPHTLHEAQVERAKIVIVALPETTDTLIAVKNIRKLNKRCYIIARIHDAKEGEQLKGYVDHLIQPEKLSALDIVWRTLHLLGAESDKT